MQEVYEEADKQDAGCVGSECAKDGAHRDSAIRMAFLIGNHFTGNPSIHSLCLRFLCSLQAGNMVLLFP